MEISHNADSSSMSSNISSNRIDFGQQSKDLAQRESTKHNFNLRHPSFCSCCSSVCYEPPVNLLPVRVVNLHSAFTCSNVEVSEPYEYLKYVTPRFRAIATLEMCRDIQGESWELGWIQAVRAFQFVNTYDGYGESAWVLPPLEDKSQLYVCDCDGSRYPWYGSTPSELRLLHSSTPSNSENSTFTISMEDMFEPRVSWGIPGSKEGPEKPCLTRVQRRQSFFTWLAIKDCRRNIVYPLRTISWKVNVKIHIDPAKPLGDRSSLLLSHFPAPRLLNYVAPLDPSALVPPRANVVQKLVWRERKRRTSRQNLSKGIFNPSSITIVQGEPPYVQQSRLGQFM